MKKKVFGKKGFTLIEVILSMAILALVSVLLLKYFSDSIDLTEFIVYNKCLVSFFIRFKIKVFI